MPAAFHIDEEAHVVHWKAWGQLTGEAILVLRARLVNDPAFSPDMSRLADLRLVTDIPEPGGHVRQLAQSDPLRAGGRQAFVVETPAVYGVVRMYTAWMDLPDDSVRIFRTIETARLWLGLGDPAVRTTV